MVHLLLYLQGTAFSMLLEKVGVKKILARCVPHLENKCNRLVDFEAVLVFFNHYPDEFLYRYLIVDEMWIHYYTPETKEQLEQ